MKIGVGLVSFGRIEFRRQARKAIKQHLSDVVDVYTESLNIFPVAKAKNKALRKLLKEGCDWIFLSEDDIVVMDIKAITGYIAACEISGYQHLMFHAHGPGNSTPIDHQGPITLWPNYVGAWCIYGRQALEKCGLFDEHFHNAWEHVEHTMRLAQHGFTPPWRGAADASGSENWIHELPGAIEQSSITHTQGWNRAFESGRDYWKETNPETYHWIWPQ